MTIDPKVLREKLLSIPGVKKVQIETVRQVIVETTNGRDLATISDIHNAEIEIIKQNPTEAFDFSVVYGAPEDEVGTIDVSDWDSNEWL